MIKKRNKHFACIISPQDVVQQLENGFNHGAFVFELLPLSFVGRFLMILNGGAQPNHVETSIMDMIHIQETMWVNTYVTTSFTIVDNIM